MLDKTFDTTDFTNDRLKKLNLLIFSIPIYVTKGASISKLCMKNQT